MTAPTRQRSSGSSGTGRRIAAAAAARKASEEFEQLTRTPVERVVGVRREETGWTVQLEAVELRRTPPTMDVLAMYEVQISGRGQVGGWERVSRYHRSQVEGA